MSVANTVSIERATLHAKPNGTGLVVEVITEAGVQVRIGVDATELGIFASEAEALLSGNADSFHAAGMRLQHRLGMIKGGGK